MYPETITRAYGDRRMCWEPTGMGIAVALLACCGPISPETVAVNQSEVPANQSEACLGTAAEHRRTCPRGCDDACDREYCARCTYSLGARAFEAGDYAMALACMVEDYRLSNRLLVLHNIGVVQERMHQDERALACYRLALSENTDPRIAARLEARIARIRSRSRE